MLQNTWSFISEKLPIYKQILKAQEQDWRCKIGSFDDG